MFIILHKMKDRTDRIEVYNFPLVWFSQEKKFIINALPNIYDHEKHKYNHRNGANL